MKKLIENYTFTASAGTIVFNDYSAINHSGVLLITNVTDGIIIYNFAAPTLGGTITDATLTLEYSTVAMSDTDSLQIWYDDGVLVGSKEDDDNLNLLLNLLLQRTADNPIWYDVATNALRVTVANTVPITIAANQDIRTVASVTNQVQMGGQSADLMTENLTKIDWALSTRNLLT